MLGRFFLPGPTEIHPDVIAAMTKPMMSHRSTAFREMFAKAQTGLKSFFVTERPVIVATSSSTGLMEMAVRSAPPGPILSLVNGGFSERFAKIANACGREVTISEVPWGHANDPDDAEHILASSRYAAVTVVHSETSTGVLNDIASISRVAHAHGAVILADTVSSLSGARVETDAWGLDFVFAGSQKALAIPPGLAFGVASNAMVESARANDARGSYFDLVEYVESAARNETPSTPALSLLYALDTQIDRIAVEGLTRRLERHEAMARKVHDWAARMSADGFAIGILAPEGNRSPTVTVLTLPNSIAPADVLRAVTSSGFTIGSGYGRLSKNSVRIGHMGDHTVESVMECLSTLERAIRTNKK